MKLSIAVAALPALLAMSLTAEAACVYPQAPQSFPNGATATKDDMLAAQAKIKEYTRAVQGPAALKPNATAEETAQYEAAKKSAYLTCLESEKNEALAKLDPADPEYAAKKLNVETIHAKKNDAAVDELTAVATRWKQEITAFQAQGAK